jgi:23S rRNA (adenine2503-C2)-methyltransferase
MNSVLDHTPDELAELFREQGIEPFRARQVAGWVFGRGVRAFEAMTNLGQPLRAELDSHWRTSALELQEQVRSTDGTVKLLLRTGDGGRVETVIIQEDQRRTLCVSSQIGCSLDCPFCATGRLGLARNLRTEEIVDQVLQARDFLATQGEHPTHVVFMGMGEPLLNLRHVIPALRILTHRDTLGLSPGRITVSPAGVVPQMPVLGRAMRVRLAVSLHATTDQVRDQLVPLNQRFPIARLIEACRAYPLAPRGRISFEYTLIRDLNDSREDARRLVRLLSGIRSHVNLIPLSEHPGTSFQRAGPEQMDRFAGVLARARVPVTVRQSRGDDILAACGQLGASGPALAAGAVSR